MPLAIVVPLSGGPRQRFLRQADIRRGTALHQHVVDFDQAFLSRRLDGRIEGSRILPVLGKLTGGHQLARHRAIGVALVELLHHIPQRRSGSRRYRQVANFVVKEVHDRIFGGTDALAIGFGDQAVAALAQCADKDRHRALATEAADFVACHAPP